MRDQLGDECRHGPALCGRLTARGGLFDDGGQLAADRRLNAVCRSGRMIPPVEAKAGTDTR